MRDSVFQEDATGVTLKVRVQPGASRNEILGIIQGSLRIRITAPPVEGAANRECIRFLSKTLGIAKSRITILRGEQGRDKILHVQGINLQDLRSKLSLKSE